MIDVNIANAETVALEEFAAFATGIGVGDGAAGLRFGIFGHQFGQFPKPSAAFREQNAEHFPGAAMIDHDFHGRSGVRVGAEFFEHALEKRITIQIFSMQRFGVDDVPRQICKHDSPRKRVFPRA